MANNAVVRAGVHCVAAILHSVLEDYLNKRRTKRKRSIWVRTWLSRRCALGASATLLTELAEEDVTSYKNHLRMSVAKFEELLKLVEPIIQKRETVLRSPIPPRTKLEITLRYLASGDSIVSLQYAFRVAKNTIYTFLPEVLSAIIKVLQPNITVPTNTNEWKEIQNVFRERWNFPNCCGALDGKHIRIKRPPGTVSEFYCYKDIYSIILFAIVDGNYCFLYTDVGCNGRTNDGSIFRNSDFNIALQNNQLNIPENGVFVGDDAFPLRTNLLKPYSNKGLTVKQRIFNYRLSRARRIVENAFGILVSRFRIFERPIGHKPETVDLIVQTCCTLHNWLRKTSGSTYLSSHTVDVEDDLTGDLTEGEWRTITRGLASVGSLGQNNHSKAAGDLRNKYADYFIEKDPLPWQKKSIGLE